MTEAEWLAWDDSARLFDCLGEFPSERMCILFVVGLAAPGEPYEPHSPDRVSERFADGELSLSEMWVQFGSERGQLWVEDARAHARWVAEGFLKRGEVRLLRCIFGNPFRPLSADPAWLTSSVVALARQMYESRDFT